MTVLEVASEALRLHIDTGAGARIVSLVATATEHEWLVQSATGIDPAGYGSSYTDREIHGWDEMLPTIDACRIKGADIPDHGEIWAVPWRTLPARHTGGVRLIVESRALPLELEREVWARGTDIVMDYRLVNRGQIPCPVQWAAHPLFAVSDSALVLVEGAAPHWMASTFDGGRMTWNDVLEAATALGPGSFLKVWLEAPTPVRAATLVDDSESLQLEWEGTAVRSLAVLWDNARFARRRGIVVEPSFGRGENTELLAAVDRALELAPGAELTWQVRLSAPTRPTEDHKGIIGDGAPA